MSLAALAVQVRLRDGDHCRFCGRLVDWTVRMGPAAGRYSHSLVGQRAESPEQMFVACARCDRDRYLPGAETQPPTAAPGRPFYGAATHRYLAAAGLLSVDVADPGVDLDGDVRPDHDDQRASGLEVHEDGVVDRDLGTGRVGVDATDHGSGPEPAVQGDLGVSHGQRDLGEPAGEVRDVDAGVQRVPQTVKVKFGGHDDLDRLGAAMARQATGSAGGAAGGDVQQCSGHGSPLVSVSVTVSVEILPPQVNR